jgi:NTE family protein
MTNVGETSIQKGETLALALSGGGSRAMAFHLGCLRALNRAGILDQATTISSVSGGSVLAALYCHQEGDFANFDRRAREILARGFVWPALRIALTTREGINAVVCVVPLALDRLAAFVVRHLLHIVAPKTADQLTWLREPFIRRWASRTTILRRVFSEVFAADNLPRLRTDRPKLIMIACELQYKSAFYFASDGVGSWRLGRADPNEVEIAQAVVASAAYPGLLPALDDRMTFVKDGKSTTQRVILTDGGVYDNLGLSPLWPDRDPKISLHVNNYERIIACRGGYGLRQGAPSIFWPSRMLAVMHAALARTENLSVNRLFDLLKSRRLKGVLVPYLGQSDSTLAFPPPDLIPASEVADYPTDFSAMPHEWIDRLSRRGEQLTLALLKEHWASC